MGIKSNFNQFIRETCPDVFETVHLSEYAYKKVAIDISLYMHKYKAVCGDRWLTAFLNLITSMRRNEIHCVFIFDGEAPPEKEQERAERRNNKEKLENSVYDLELAYDEYQKTGIISDILKDMHAKRRSPPVRLMKKQPVTIDMAWVEKKIKQKRNQLYQVSPTDFDLAKRLFRILKVPFFTAPSEAEKMCSKLCIDGHVAAVISEDTDVLAYASPIFLTKIDTAADTCVRIDYEYLLERLGLTTAQFLDLCILCGTDYNKNIAKIGSKTAYKYIQKYIDIDGIDTNTDIDISVLNHHRVRELFRIFSENTIEKIPYCAPPDFLALEEFIKEQNIKISLDTLKRAYEPEFVIIDDNENSSINTETSPKLSESSDTIDTQINYEIYYKNHQEIQFYTFTLDEFGKKVHDDKPPTDEYFVVDFIVNKTGKYQVFLVGKISDCEYTIYNLGLFDQAEQTEDTINQIHSHISNCNPYTINGFAMYSADISKYPKPIEVTNQEILDINPAEFRDPSMIITIDPEGLIDSYLILPKLVL